MITYYLFKTLLLLVTTILIIYSIFNLNF